MGDLADREEDGALRGYGHSLCLQWVCVLIRAGLNLDRLAQTRHLHVGFFFFFPCVAQVLLQCKGTEKASDSHQKGVESAPSLCQGNYILFG